MRFEGVIIFIQTGHTHRTPLKYHTRNRRFSSLVLAISHEQYARMRVYNRVCVGP